MRLPTRLPIPGAELTSSFGNRIDPFAHSHAFHAGLDFAARAGTPIFSAAGGVVAFAGFRRDFGWVVEIDHGNGLATRSRTPRNCSFEPARVVVPGDRIAMVGSSGRSTGARLRFEVLRFGRTTSTRGAIWWGCERSPRRVDRIRARSDPGPDPGRPHAGAAPALGARRARGHAPRRRGLRRRRRHRRGAARARARGRPPRAGGAERRSSFSFACSSSRRAWGCASPTRAAQELEKQIDALNQKLTESQDELTFFRKAREGREH